MLGNYALTEANLVAMTVEQRKDVQKNEFNTKQLRAMIGWMR